MTEAVMTPETECAMLTYATPGLEAPTLDELLKCVHRGTLDGVLESALHLSDEDYAILVDAHKSAVRERRRNPNLPKNRRRK